MKICYFHCSIIVHHFLLCARTRVLEKQKRVFHPFFVSLFFAGACTRTMSTPVETLQETLLLPCSLSMYLGTKKIQSVAF